MPPLTSKSSARGALALLALGVTLLLAACGSAGSSGDSTGSTASGESTSPSQEPFSSYEFKPPKFEYRGPLFELSQDYPTQMPPAAEMPGFFKTDFRKDWRTYMDEAREYCFEGNTDVEWRGQDNAVRPWFHMPWQDYGDNGREGIHGLTLEASVRPGQLAKDQKYGKGATYAVGLYNDFGGYTIGKVWQNHEEPDPGYAATQGFPEGTVVCKLLFVNIPPAVVAEEIPFLVNPIRWQAYADKPTGSGRAVQDVTLIQMDFMVRDERASAGWIFGTFQYNGKLAKPDRWENLAPVGLMWGNDPDQTEGAPKENSSGRFTSPGVGASTQINAALDETVVNPDRNELPPTHLGWNGRLNGPVDNSLSSCMSCHMTASSPERPLSPTFLGTEIDENEPNKPIRPKTNSPKWEEFWMQWFENVGWKEGKLEPFLEAKYPLDFSLQLSDALQNFYLAEEERKPVNPVRR
jgi:hypothetical protein